MARNGDWRITLTAREAFNKVQDYIAQNIERQYEAICNSIEYAIEHRELYIDVAKPVRREVLKRFKDLGYYVFDENGNNHRISWDLTRAVREA